MTGQYGRSHASTRKSIFPSERISSIPVAPPDGKPGEKPWVNLDLDTIPIVTGTIANPPPAAIRDDPRFARSVVVRCPDNVAAKSAEVTFEVRRQYTEFRAHAWGFIDPPKAIAIRAVVRTLPPEVVSKTDPDPKKVAETQLTMGEGRALTADIGGAYRLQLEITCELPGGYMVFAGAAVR